MTDVMVPPLGESVTEATVSTWFKKPGDVVKLDEMLCELETDKVSVEVPSPVAGVLAEILVPEGTTGPAGARLAIVTEGATAPAAAPKAAAPAVVAPVAPATGLGTSTETLSVSNSQSISSAFTTSPGFLNQVETVASVTLSPKGGTITSVITISSLGQGVVDEGCLFGFVFAGQTRRG